MTTLNLTWKESTAGLMVQFSVLVNLQRKRKKLNQPQQHVIINHKDVMTSRVGAKRCLLCDGEKIQWSGAIHNACFRVFHRLSRYTPSIRPTVWVAKAINRLELSPRTDSHSLAHSHALPVRDLWLAVNTQGWSSASSVVGMTTQQLCVPACVCVR